jgi:general secretion pathway protein F
MPAYRYQALDAAGDRQEGRIEAASAEIARRLLRDRRLSPLALEAVSSPPDSRRTRSSGSRPRRQDALPLRTMAIAFRQLATLSASGVRIEEALRVAARQAATPRAASILDRARSQVTDGQSLAAALSDAGGAFPDHLIASVASGERSGRLADVLGHLASQLEQSDATQGRLGLALLYPGILAGVSILMVTLLMIFVVPDIVRVFAARDVQLPWLTRGLIALSDGLARHGVQIALLLLAGGLLAHVWARRPRNRLRLHRMATTTPGLARISRQLNAARFAGVMATLVQSGVPLLEALRTARDAVSNLHVRAQVEIAARRVHDGGSLSSAIEQCRCFPPMLVAMIASGEVGGRLGAALEQASREQQRELEKTIAALVALVEPLVLLVMGGVVLMLVLAILAPIVSINNLPV